MIEIKVADEMDNAALAKIYYDIRLKEFVWKKKYVWMILKRVQKAKEYWLVLWMEL